MNWLWSKALHLSSTESVAISSIFKLCKVFRFTECYPEEQVMSGNLQQLLHCIVFLYAWLNAGFDIQHKSVTGLAVLAVLPIFTIRL